MTFTKTEVDVVLMAIVYPIFIVGLSWAVWPIIQRGAFFLIPINICLLLLIHMLVYAWPASRQRRRAKRQLMSLLAQQADDQAPELQANQFAQRHLESEN